ncbi:CehA/McbA family metallohydrolase, partial [Candidatus Poribacteria bacterium]|nr:CehA/McbA family metallohydrolase [Candidatus Poribacteria bacterium]
DVETPVLVRHPYYFTVMEVALPDDIRGAIRIYPTIRATVEGRAHTFGVSGHPSLSKEPLSVYVADDPLPAVDGWTYADTHCHSWHTSDQIEFGAPPEMLTRMARAVGLRWVFITDHSFDLTVPPGRWFGEDPTGARWHTLEQEIKEVNSANGDITLIRGEEVSCGSVDGKNLHLLVYGVPELIPGKGDAAKRWRVWQNRPDMSMRDVLEIVRRHGATAFASHPMNEPSLMERTVLNRGSWQEADLHQDLDGWEIWNTDSVAPFRQAREDWIRLLLKGSRKPVIAGSDAHGDFNRMRSINMPFLAVEECFREAFGRPRTALYTPEPTLPCVYDAMRAGRAVMTNGPFVTLSVAAGDGPRVEMGESARPGDAVVHVQARSTEEFGELTRVTLYVGTVGGSESPLVLGANVGLARDITGQLTLEAGSYLRVEAEAQRGDSATCAFTNPIWVDAP